MEVLLNVEPVGSQHNLKGLRHFFGLIESPRMQPQVIRSDTWFVWRSSVVSVVRGSRQQGSSCVLVSSVLSPAELSSVRIRWISLT